MYLVPDHIELKDDFSRSGVGKRSILPQLNVRAVRGVPAYTNVVSTSKGSVKGSSPIVSFTLD